MLTTIYCGDCITPYSFGTLQDGTMVIAESKSFVRNDDDTFSIIEGEKYAVIPNDTLDCELQYEDNDLLDHGHYRVADTYCTTVIIGEREDGTEFVVDIKNYKIINENY